MRHFLKIAEGIDVAPVLAELDAHPELWGQIPYRKTFQGTPHSRMDDVWFHYADPARYAPGDLKSMMNEHIPIWYPAVKAVPSVRRITMDLMARVEGEAIGLVMITRIPPGAGLDPHIDRGWHCDYHDKFYVSLQSEPGSLFCTDGRKSYDVEPEPTEALNPRPGECWLFDNHRNHWVVNESPVDRLTLIVCIHTEKFNSFHERVV